MHREHEQVLELLARVVQVGEVVAAAELLEGGSVESKICSSFVASADNRLVPAYVRACLYARTNGGAPRRDLVCPDDKCTITTDTLCDKPSAATY